MKANYLQKNKSRRSYFKRIIVLATILILGAIIFRFFNGVIISTVSTIWESENAISRSLRNSISFFNLQKDLVEENTTLKEKLSSLETRLLFLSENKVQEDILLELAGRKQRPEMITATVLTRPPQTPYDIIVVDVGSDEDISVNSEVFMPEGPVLGRVSEVFSKSAKVRLLSSSGTETNAVLERNNMPVTLVGIGGGNFKINIPRDIEVEEGDRILSADITSRLIAIVREISVRPTDSFKKVLANIPTNIFAIRFVFVTP